MAAGGTGPRRMRPARVVIPVAIAALVIVALGARQCSPAPAVDQAEAVGIATQAAAMMSSERAPTTNFPRR